MTSVLVVEDTTFVAADIAQKLNALGYTLAGIAASGEESVAMVATCRPDVVLMDIHLLGEIDGIEAARQIKETFDTPVIILSASADLATVRRATSVEPAGYLVKPVASEPLRAALEVALYADTVARHHRALEKIREAFVSTMTHDLRTPITSIVGYSELALDGALGELSPDMRQAMETIQSNGARLSQLIDELLVLRSMEHSDDIQRENCNLTSVVNRVLDMVRPALTGKGIQLETALDDVELSGSRSELERAVTNLLSNAVKFTPNHGAIGVRLSNSDPITLEISDTGIGIPADELGLLGQPFTRASNALTESTPGTGLGLSIVHRVAARHQGSFDLSSTVGAGTTARLVLSRSAD